MKDFLAVFITILIFITWLIPAFMQWHTGVGNWGALYISISGFTSWWLYIIDQHYFKK